MRWSIPSSGYPKVSEHWYATTETARLIQKRVSPVGAETIAIIAILVAAGSELLALSSLRSNSWLQLLFQALKLAFPKRR